MVNKALLWIDGKYIAPISGEYFPDINPVQDEIISYIGASSEADVDVAINSAQQAFENLKLGLQEREALFSNAADILSKERMAFVELLIDEIGSPVSKAQFEVDMAIEAFRASAGMARRITGRTFPSEATGRISMSVREPRGVVASITPFNVPLLIAVKASSMALAAGNTVVALPSEDAPLVMLRLAELYTQAGLPAGMLNVITGKGSQIGDALTKDPRVKAVLFTGSSVVGRHIGGICGERLKPAILELGGKSPMIVLDDADIDKAVEAAVFGIFLFQGQVCMGSSRIYVMDSVYETFSQAFAQATTELRVGDLRNPETMIGPIINQRQRDRVRGHIDDALAKGGKLLAGGEWRDNICMPTIIAGAHKDMQVFDEETFGPVAQIYPIANLDEGLRLANKSRYGLSSAIFTRDISKALRFANEIHSGMVHINSSTIHDEPHVPFGGMGESGMGRTGTEESLAALTQTKWITAEI